MTERKLALTAGASELGLRLRRDAVTKLLRFLEILERWNRRVNLTAVPREQMVPAHLLDSLSVAAFLRGTSLLDIGSGAGLPGIPLAIAHPERAVILLESRSKRAQFLVHAVSELDLTNVEVVHERAERYRPQRKFDTLVARAFGPLPKLLSAAARLCPADGRILALKGRYPAKEIAEIASTGFEVLEVVQLQVPQLAAARHVVILRPKLEGAVATRQRSPE